MAKNKGDSTIENRVYLFRDLAGTWLAENGEMLASEEERPAALRALADIAYVSCVVADTEQDSAAEVAMAVQKGPER